MNISEITSRQILDSRGNPTLETTVVLDTGDRGTAAVPSGASTGSHEAVELRDGSGGAYSGLAVMKAIQHVQGPIAKALHGVDVRDQKKIDATMIELDGTVNKSSLGANAILSVSLAVARAHAVLTKRPLWSVIRELYDADDQTPVTPRIMMNVINGGRHADNGLQFQEFLIEPKGASIPEMIERGVGIYHALGKILKDRGLSTLFGDEGGFAPKLRDERQALDLLLEAIERCGCTPGTDVELGLDCASSEFYDHATQTYHFGSDHGLSGQGIIDVIQDLTRTYPLRTIEDPLAEDDWQHWTQLTEKIGADRLIIGDDLFVTSNARLSMGIEKKAGNAILIKPNQVGSLSETLDTIQTAQAHHFPTIVSHRSGETGDTAIIDIAVGTNSPWVKIGAPARGERVAKYNRLLAWWESERG